MDPSFASREGGDFRLEVMVLVGFPENRKEKDGTGQMNELGFPWMGKELCEAWVEV